MIKGAKKNAKKLFSVFFNSQSNNVNLETILAVFFCKNSFYIMYTVISKPVKIHSTTLCMYVVSPVTSKIYFQKLNIFPSKKTALSKKPIIFELKIKS